MFSTQLSATNPINNTSHMLHITNQKLLAELLEVYKEYREAWLARSAAARGLEGITHGTAQLVRTKLENKISEVSSFIATEFYLLPAIENKIRDGLLNLEYAMKLGSMRKDHEWEISMAQIKMICENPHKADQLSRVLMWLNENKLGNQVNYNKLINDERNLESLTLLNSIRFSNKTQLGQFEITVELKQRIFDEVLSNFASTPQVEMTNTSSASSSASLSISEKKYHVKHIDLEAILDLYDGLDVNEKAIACPRRIVTNTVSIGWSESGQHLTRDDIVASKGFSQEKTDELIAQLKLLVLPKILNDSNENSLAVKAENLFADQESDLELRLINEEQLYIITRILNVASIPAKPRQYGYVPHVTKKELSEEKTKSVNTAKTLYQAMFGSARFNALNSLWEEALEEGSSSLYFDFSTVVQLFSAPENLTEDFVSAIIFLHVISKPELQDVKDVVEYLQSKSNEAEAVKYSIEVHGHFAKFLCAKTPVLLFANALYWLKLSSIRTFENKLVIAQYADHLNVLVGVCIDADDSLESKQLAQNIFNFIVSDIAQQLKNQVVVSSDSVSQYSGNFMNTLASNNARRDDQLDEKSDDNRLTFSK